MSIPSRAAALLLAVIFTGGCASLQPAADVPAKLEPGASEAQALTSRARGVQIYECRAAKDQTGYAWAFVAPEAELFDASGTRKIGRHYAGPHWEAADGSTVAGTTRQSANAPVDGAIPWLLLSAKSVGAEGSFSKFTSVQRIHTAGGAAPTGGCSEAEAGKQARVVYTADYVFFAPRRGSPDSGIGFGY